MSKYVLVKDDEGFNARGVVNGKQISLGFFSTKELAQEAKDFFNNECGRDIEKYKQSKYWKELRRLSANSEGYAKKGMLRKTTSGAYQAICSTNNGKVTLGSFDTEILGREAINYFINECHENFEEYKKSKYWKELRRTGTKSPEYAKKGWISKNVTNTYKVVCSNGFGKEVQLGTFDTKELAQEALNYFTKECNYDLNKYKQSKYWLEKTDIRNVSKAYWERNKITARNTSGVTGVTLFNMNGYLYWMAGIAINRKSFRRYFKSKENAIKYRDFLVEQGKEFNENWDEARKQKQMEFIKEQSEKLAQELKNNSDEKKAIEEEKQETQYEFTKVEE